MIPGELIPIFLGNEAVRVAVQLHRIYAKQHEIDEGVQIYKSDPLSEVQTLERMFHVTSIQGQGQNRRRIVSRAILIGSSQKEMDAIMSSIEFQEVKYLFSKYNIIFQSENLEGNYLFSKLLDKTKFLSEVKDRIVEEAKVCSKLEGFVIYHSAGASTAAGVLGEIAPYLKQQFPQTLTLNFMINPDIRSLPESEAIRQSYNASYTFWILSNHFSDIAVCFDSSKIKRLCSVTLGTQKIAERQINCLLCRCLSNLTYSFRFQCCINTTLQQMSQNLIPYQELKFCMAFYSPLQTSSQTVSQLNSEEPKKASLMDVIRPLVLKNFSLCDFEPYFSKYMSSVVLYRGKTIVPKQTGPTIQFLKGGRYFRYVDWAPSGFRCSLFYRPITALSDDCFAVPEKEITMVCLNTGIMESIDNFLGPFEKNVANKVWFEKFEEDRFDTEIFERMLQKHRHIESQYEEAQIEHVEQLQEW